MTSDSSKVCTELLDKLFMLKIRREITQGEHILLSSTLAATNILQDLCTPNTKVKCVVVVSHQMIVNLIQKASVQLPSGWYLLTVPITPRITNYSSEMARDIADVFSVNMRKLLAGRVSKYPDVIGVSSSLHSDNSRFPGALTWALKHCPFIHWRGKSIWMTCNVAKVHATSGVLMLKSMELKIELEDGLSTFADTVNYVSTKLLERNNGESMLQSLLGGCLQSFLAPGTSA